VMLLGGSAPAGVDGAGVHVVARDALSARELKSLETAATMVVEEGWRMPTVVRWSKDAAEDEAPGSAADGLEPKPRPAATADATIEAWNGYGGFAAEGRAYLMRLSPAPDGTPRRPPLPWTNVLANPDFGTLVSESGAGCTWSGNSREHRLTPWS